MSSKMYLVTCKNCNAKRQVGIIEGQMNKIIDWLDNNPDPQLVKIISGRMRFDDQWGWECVCGNNDLWTEQEKANVKDRVSPKPKEIAQIINDLKAEKPKFSMEMI